MILTLDDTNVSHLISPGDPWQVQAEVRGTSLFNKTLPSREPSQQNAFKKMGKEKVRTQQTKWS